MRTKSEEFRVKSGAWRVESGIKAHLSASCRGGVAVPAKRLPLWGSWLAAGQTDEVESRQAWHFIKATSSGASRHLPHRGRLASFALILVLVALALTGCHGSRGRSGFEVPEAFDASRQYELTFWAKNDTNKAQTDIYKNAIAGFEALYPNIKVNLKLYTDYGRIYNDVITNISTNTTPNVCISYPDHIATYLTGDNVVAPLDALFDDAKYGLGGSELRFDGPARDELIPQFLDECAFSGGTYAVPYMRSTEAMYINRTYVEKLGYELPEVLTWDFVWEVAEAAVKKDASGVYAVNGQKVMIPFIYKSTDNMMIQMLKQLDAGYSTDAGEVLLLNDTTKELLLEIAQHAATGAFSTFKISSYPANFLNAGQCIFAVDSTAGATWMGSEAPLLDIAPENLVQFETAVRMVPQYDPEHPKMISQGPSLCVFNKADPQEVLASWLFTQYLLTDDVQIAYSQTEGYVPVTSKARNTPEYQDYLNSDAGDALHYPVKLQATKLLLDNTENTFTTPVFNGSASLRDAAGALIESVTKSVRRKQTVDDAFIDKLYDDTASLYRLNQSSGRSGMTSGGDLGPLPAGSRALLIGLVCVWVLLGAYTIAGKVRKKR